MRGGKIHADPRVLFQLSKNAAHLGKPAVAEHTDIAGLVGRELRRGHHTPKDMQPPGVADGENGKHFLPKLFGGRLFFLAFHDVKPQAKAEFYYLHSPSKGNSLP
jgi:hypothetical protein